MVKKAEAVIDERGRERHERWPECVVQAGIPVCAHCREDLRTAGVPDLGSTCDSCSAGLCRHCAGGHC